MLACIETKPSDAACRQKASVACGRGLAKLATDGDKMRAAVVKACGVLTPADRGSAVGLGFDAATGVCSDLGQVVSDVVGLATCTAARGRCTADALMTSVEPRAGELLRLAGAVLEPDACVDDFGGNGADLSDPKGIGTDVVKCARALIRAGRTLAATRVARLADCVNAVFGCVQLHQGDAGCLGKASLRCGADVGKIGTAE